MYVLVDKRKYTQLNAPYFYFIFLEHILLC